MSADPVTTTDTKSANPVADAIDAFVAQLADVRKRIAHLKAIDKELAAKVRSFVPAGTIREPHADMLVTVTQPMAFDPEMARKILSPKVLASITEKVTTETISEKLAVEILPGKLFKACQTPKGEPRITFGGK
jgi:Asp-tRNA(Asn)/Glu-tRNA(Gln) amidotransferase B subunit